MYPNWSTNSELALFSATTLQVAFFAILIMIISSVSCLFVGMTSVDVRSTITFIES